MPSPFAHVATGYLIYKIAKDKLPGDTTRKWFMLPVHLLVFMGLSVLPDIDTLPGLIFGDMHGFHNNYTHSLISGLVIALVAAAVLSNLFKTTFLSWFPAALASYELHIIMDFFTSGRGVKLFWPLYPERIIAPVKLFVGFQWGLGILSPWHLWTFFTEAIFFLILFFLLNVLQKSRRKPAVLQSAMGDD
jgi:inner membrane protein